MKKYFVFVWNLAVCAAFVFIMRREGFSWLFSLLLPLTLFDIYCALGLIIDCIKENEAQALEREIVISQRFNEMRQRFHKRCDELADEIGENYRELRELIQKK